LQSFILGASDNGLSGSGSAVVRASKAAGTFLCGCDFHEIVLGWSTTPARRLVHWSNFAQTNTRHGSA